MAEETATTPVADATPAPAPEVDVNADISTPTMAGMEADVRDPVSGADTTSGGEDGAEGEAKPEPPETIELELDGKKYKVDKALQSAFLMNKDYTQKTQQVAEAARLVEQARVAFETERKSQTEALQAELDDHAQVHALKRDLAQWANVNWALLEQNDRENGTNELAMAMLRHNQLKDRLAGAQEALNTKVSERQAKEQAEQKRMTEAEAAEDAKLLRDGYQYLTQKIPDWPKVAPSVVDFGATRFGFSQQELAAVRDPRMYEVLHMAMLGAKSLDSRKATERAEKAQQTQPAATVNGRGAPPNAEPKDPVAWMKWRNAQVKAAEEARRR